MNSLAEGIQNAIQYIEDNLTEELNIDSIAAKAYVSSFHFQRIFSAVCGITVGEYIRNRRKTAKRIAGDIGDRRLHLYCGPDQGTGRDLAER